MFRISRLILASLSCLVVLLGGANLPAQNATPTWTIPLYKPGEGPTEQQGQPNQLAQVGKFQIDLFELGGKVVVPSLKGLTWTAAEEKLAALNLKAQKKKRIRLECRYR